ncbi:inorganic phosphate transporter Pho88, partial [Spinellus fusiger]
NVVFSLFIRQLTKIFHWDTPENIPIIRVIYLITQACVLAAGYWLIVIVRRRNDQTPLRYLEPSSYRWSGQDESQLINTTHLDYDVAEIKKTIKQTFTSIAIVAFLHLQFQFVQPIIIQSVLGFKTLVLTKEARLHLWKESSTGDLRRPFRMESFLGVPEGWQPKVGKNTIKKAEK